MQNSTASFLPEAGILVVTDDQLLSIDKDTLESTSLLFFKKRFEDYGTVVVHHHVYFIGGSVGLQRYNLQKRKMNKNLSQPHLFMQMPTCTYYRGKIYCFKSCHNHPGNFVSEYDTTNDTWTSYPNVGINCKTVSAFEHNQSLVIVYHKRQETEVTLKRFDTVNRTLIDYSQFKLKCRRYGDPDAIRGFVTEGTIHLLIPELEYSCPDEWIRVSCVDRDLLQRPMFLLDKDPHTIVSKLVTGTRRKYWKLVKVEESTDWKPEWKRKDITAAMVYHQAE